MNKEKFTMKLTGKLILMTLTFVFTGTLLAQDKQTYPEGTGDVLVIIEGLKNDNGTVQIGLFNSEQSWKGKTEKFKGAVISIKDKKAEWKLVAIPYGEYAIRLFHDENNDNKLNTNFLGMPKESYGFSNNAKAKFGIPGFDKVKFRIDSENQVIYIKLN